MLSLQIFIPTHVACWIRTYCLGRQITSQIPWKIRLLKSCCREKKPLTLHKLLHLLSDHLWHKPNCTKEPQNKPTQPEQTASPDLRAVGHNFPCFMKQILCCKFLGVKVLNCFNAPSDLVEYRVSVAEQLTGRSGTPRQAKSWQGLKVNSWGLEMNEPDKRSLSN